MEETLSGLPGNLLPYPKRQRKERWPDWSARLRAFEEAHPDHPEVLHRCAERLRRRERLSPPELGVTSRRLKQEHYAFSREQGHFWDDPPRTWEPAAFIFTYPMHHNGIPYRQNRLGQYVKANLLALLCNRWYGTPLSPTPRPENCMHHEPWPCFDRLPEEQYTLIVSGLAPIPDGCYLPGFEPAMYHRRIHWRLCCWQAARLKLRALHAAGWRDLRLEPEEENPPQDIDHHIRILNTTMPCLG